MKKVVAFLLALIIFVAPVTTLVKADVVIGDNDDIIINENAIILGRKLALMESLSDLALSGVTEFTIYNTNDVDSYLDSLWSELNDAIDSLSDGTGFTEISNTLKSKYFTNLVQYKDYITNRGTYLAQLLPTGSPTTTLLSTFFANNIYGKHITQHYDLALDMFKALSEFSNSPDLPENPEDIQTILDDINVKVFSQWNEYTIDTSIGGTIVAVQEEWGRTDLNLSSFVFGNGSYLFNAYVVPYCNVYITNNNDYYTVTCSDYYNKPIILNGYKNILYTYEQPNKPFIYDTRSTYITNNQNFYVNANFGNTIGTSSTITGALNIVKTHFAYCYVYIDNVLVSYPIGAISSSPILDIEGLLKIYGNDNPTQYQLQPNTSIDYDQLYQVIYNAIRDNLPISQGDINYYDSHDTIYSPTIINNYGEEDGDESDLIDTILNYAVIPKFDTAIAQPMRQALTNGVVIMNKSITDVIPNEILFILGACFFLLLFAVVINRMIK